MYIKMVVISKNEINPSYRWASTKFFDRIPKDMWYKISDLGMYESKFWIKKKDLWEVRLFGASDYALYTMREWRQLQAKKNKKRVRG